MTELATIIALGAGASVLVLTIAPLSLVYVAAFVTLTPILGITLWRVGVVLLDAAIGVGGAVRLGMRAREAGYAPPPVVESSPTVPRMLPGGESESVYELSAAASIYEPSAAASVPDAVAEPTPASPLDAGEAEPGKSEDQGA